ncbi:cytochrome c [Bdellovibrio bacteriovorus]|uniref:c-type cytochrome n=1 Tax=Bdellovibrio TaxID=958 RepID=UPI0035A978DA
MRAGVKRGLIAGSAAVVLVLGFQNCSDFALQDQVLYDQGIFESREALDAKTLPVLLEAEELSMWSKPGQPNFVNKAMLADQVSMIIAADTTATGNLITVRAGAGSEESSISVTGGKIRAMRFNSVGTSYSEYLEVALPSSGDKMVVAAAFGAKASEISLLVNGVVQSGTLVKTGTPFDYSYTQKDKTSAPAAGQVYEYVVFGGDSVSKKGKLTNSELNVMARYVANNNMIANVIYDPALLNDTGDGGGGDDVNPKFVTAKAIIDAKCINCHKSGGNSPNLVNLTESKAVGNAWVIKANPEGSKLYYRLQGSSGPGSKDMPSGGSISAAEVQAIADWINSIP